MDAYCHCHSNIPFQHVISIVMFFIGALKSEPLMLPGRHIMNLGLLLSNIGAMGWFMIDKNYEVGLSMLAATSSLSAVMGVTLTMAIGGGSHSLPAPHGSPRVYNDYSQPFCMHFLST